MSDIRLLLNGYRYFPYEKDFAVREIHALSGEKPKRVSGGYSIQGTSVHLKELSRLTYVERVVAGPHTVLTLQAQLEGSLTESTNAKRQATRYSAHGLHDYRGKFNPQVVRAIGNIVGVAHGSWVLDPFGGSGTTALECLHAQWSCASVDLNPLATLIAQAKLTAIRTAPDLLRDGLRELEEGFASVLERADFASAWSEKQVVALAGKGWLDALPCGAYLDRWFPRSVLGQLGAVLRAIDDFGDPLALIFRVVLSDLVRDASHQEPADLRVRRRKVALENFPVIPMFLKRLATQVERIARASQLVMPYESTQVAVCGDSRLGLTWLTECLPASKFDAVITSPPYATALPYADTQRLSLVLLGLVSDAQLSTLERELTGSREIQESERRELEDALRRGEAHDLPDGVVRLCRRMASLTANSESDGFRRRNTPALTFRYFRDMASTFRSTHAVTSRNAPMALVVGKNRTNLGGTDLTIDTPRLLKETACENGWRAVESIPMNTYSRYDMHAANSIRSEALMVLTRA